MRTAARLALVLAIAAFGATVVRNVTAALIDIGRPHPTIAAIDTPRR